MKRVKVIYGVLELGSVRNLVPPRIVGIVELALRFCINYVLWKNFLKLWQASRLEGLVYIGMCVTFWPKKFQSFCMQNFCAPPPPPEK